MSIVGESRYPASVQLDRSALRVVVMGQFASGLELLAAVAAHEVVPVLALVHFRYVVEVFFCGIELDGWT